MTPTLLRDGVETVSGSVFQYRAHLSPTEEVLIANLGAPFRDDWQVLRIKDGVIGPWMGNYSSLPIVPKVPSDPLANPLFTGVSPVRLSVGVSGLYVHLGQLKWNAAKLPAV